MPLFIKMFIRVRNTKLVALVTFIGILATIAKPALASNECIGDLTLSVSLALPKELSLKANALHAMFEYPEDRALLESLHRIFAFSTNENLELISDWLRDNPDLELTYPEPTSVYFKNASAAAVRNFHLLKQNIDAFETNLSDDDLVLIAVFLEKASFQPRIKQGSVSDAGSLYHRLAIALTQRRYNDALAVMMTSQRSKTLFKQDWNKREISQSLDFDTTWNRALAQLPTGKLDAEAKRLLRIYSLIFYRQHHDEITADFEGTQDYTTDRYAEAIENFLAIDLKIPSNISEITALILYCFYDVPLPSAPNEIKQMLLDGAGRILLPAKARFSRIAAEADRKQKRERSKSIASLDLKIIDFFPPPQVAAAKQRGGKVAVSATAQNFGLNIPYDISLKHFSRAVEAPRPLAELESHKTYQVVHLRESRQVIESIVFSPEALAWLRRNELISRQILDAFTMGRARARKQNGIKRLVKRSPFIKGAVFEIKNPSGYRPLMARVNGQWQVITIVEHGSVNLAVESLKPFRP